MASTIPVLTIADLLEQFGPIPASRIRHDPPPGTATEEDVVEIEAREDRLYELIDGVLLEKAVGYYEAYLAFQAGVRLVWYVYPVTHSVRVYSNPHEVIELSGEAILDGGDVLPGYRLPLADLFAMPKQSDG